VCIPWRPDNALRTAAFHWNLVRWQFLLPGVPVVVSDSGPGEFNRARARNNAVGIVDADVVVMADADTTLLSHRQMEAALQLMYDGARWVLPYCDYYNTTAADTSLLLARPADAVLERPQEYEHLVTDAVSGVLLIPGHAFDQVRYDERFVGWGYEDNAFQVALDAMIGPHVRMPGAVLHLWHPIPDDGAFNSPNIAANRALFMRYRQARHSPDAMRALATHHEPGG
jgi:hypothetical protein